MPEYMLSDFSGGLVDPRVADSPAQAVQLTDLAHDHRVLRTMPDHLVLGASASGIRFGTATLSQLSCLSRYEAPSWLDGDLAGDTVWVGKLGKTLVLGVQSGSNVRWYPLVGSSSIASVTAHGDYTDAANITAWPPPRRTQSAEMFAQVGRYLYSAPHEPGQYDRLIRWDGWAILDRDGTYNPTGGTGTGAISTNLYGTTWNPVTAGVRVGDQVFAWSETLGAWLADQGGVVKQVGPTAVYLSAPMGADVPGTTRFVFVRAHLAGIPWWGTNAAGAARTVAQFTTREAALLDPAISNGSYSYAFRLGNSNTGYFGNLSAASEEVYVTDGARGRITVRLWLDQPATADMTALVDRDIDTLEIYRSFNRGWWRKVRTITTRATITASGSWTDTGFSAGDILGDDYELCGRPPAVRGVVAANARLWALGTWESGNTLRCSSLDRYEHWPDRQHGADIEEDYSYAGARFTLGDARSDDIRALVPEGSNFNISGISGSNMLVLTNTRAWRISGWDERDWAISPAFAVGSSRFGAALNWNGMVVFPSSDQLMGLPAGAAEPGGMGLAIWPYGFAGQGIDHSAWQLATWNSKLIILTAAGASRRVLVAHPDGTWSQISADWRVLHTSSDGTCYAAGDDLDVTDVYGGSGASTGTYRSGRLVLEESDEEGAYNLERYKAVREAHVWLRRGDSSAEVTGDFTLEILDDGVEAYSSTQSVTFAEGRRLAHLRFIPRRDVVNPAVGIETALPDTQVRLVRLDWDPQKVRGR